MSHPAFEEAGSGPGIEVWTIDKFEPVPVNSKMYGKFYNGDSYIVLKSTGSENSTLHYDAHFWLGSNSSQDKWGSAAIWTVTLDDQLGGKAVHHREVQGHESSQFLQYFQPAIRYLEGGNESGFTEVETNAGAEKRLLRLSGCDNMRIEEVPAESTSLSKEHCFILEVDHDIYVLMPEGAKATQRRKIIQVANSLRDDYHNGRASIEIIDDFSSDEDIAQFFDALGSGSMEDLVSEQSADTYTRDDPSAVYLYRVLLDGFELISLSKPYKQSQLNPDDIYILDTPCAGVFIWIGSGVDSAAKKSYNDVLTNYLEAKGYPAWVNVTRVAEGSESANFKQYFHNWDSVGSSAGFRSLLTETDGGYYSQDAEESAASMKLIGKSATARGYMPDQGDGSLSVIRISDDQEDITDQIVGFAKLYQSEVYVVKYEYTIEDEANYVLYCWVGTDATDDDKKAAFDLVSELEDDFGDKAIVVKVPQGKEPKHFLSIFKGHLAILFGDKDSEYKPTNSRGTYDEDGVRLFRVEGTEPGVDMRGVQVPEAAAVLEDDDVFVLETSQAVYVRNGKDSFPSEQEAALEFVNLVAGDEREIIVFDQDEEPEAFWDALGGGEEIEDASGWKKAVSRRLTTPASLTSVSVSVTGKIKFEDLAPDFTQQDLSDDGIYILDTGEELYLWQGSEISERIKQARSEIVKEFISADGLDRTVDSAVVVGVKRGKEPAVFRQLFPEWDPEMWDNLTSYEDIKNETKAANSK